MKGDDVYGNLVCDVLLFLLIGFFVVVVLGVVFFSFNLVFNLVCILFSLGFYKNVLCFKVFEWEVVCLG